MKFNDIYNEEKVRLDPKCWTGKKIGNPKTKVKGGVRVNNCVPAESVEEAANAAQQAAIAINMKKHDQKPKSMSEHMADGDYNGEYDDEAGMAEGNLYTIAQAAQGLIDTIGDRDDLPEWCQEKIAKVEGMLVSVWNYLQSQKAQGIDPQIEEMFEAMDQLAAEMAQKNSTSVDLVWEAFEALPDHVLYETAAWQKSSGKNKNGGLNRKGVMSYRREHPGSKLQTAVTTKPSKLKPGSKAAKRRKSFCARMSGVKGPMKKPNGKPTRKALALRKWNC